MEGAEHGNAAFFARFRCVRAEAEAEGVEAGAGRLVDDIDIDIDEDSEGGGGGGGEEGAEPVCFEWCEMTGRQLVREVQRLRRQVHDRRVALEAVQVRNAEVEEALEVRVSGAGMQGQSALLTDLARLRGENQALRKEAERVQALVCEAENGTRKVREEKAELERELQGVRDQLAEKQRECARYTGTETGEQLRQTEAERDTLLEYMQDVMDRLNTAQHENASLTKRVQSLTAAEAEHEALRAEVARLQGLLEAERARSRETDERAREDHSTAAGLRQTLQTRELEVEELGKVQIDLLTSIREKEEAVERKAGELRRYRRHGKELEKRLTEAQREVAQLTEHLEESRATTTRLQDRLSQLEPKLSGAQRELDSLRHIQTDYDKAQGENRSLAVQAERANALAAECETLRSDNRALSNELFELRNVRAEKQALTEEVGALRARCDALALIQADRIRSSTAAGTDPTHVPLAASVAAGSPQAHPPLRNSPRSRDDTASTSSPGNSSPSGGAGAMSSPYRRYVVHGEPADTALPRSTERHRQMWERMQAKYPLGAAAASGSAAAATAATAEPPVTGGSTNHYGAESSILTNIARLDRIRRGLTATAGTGAAAPSTPGSAGTSVPPPATGTRNEELQARLQRAYDLFSKVE